MKELKEILDQLNECLSITKIEIKHNKQEEYLLGKEQGITMAINLIEGYTQNKRENIHSIIITPKTIVHCLSWEEFQNISSLFKLSPNSYIEYMDEINNGKMCLGLGGIGYMSLYQKMSNPIYQASYIIQEIKEGSQLNFIY
jgi:hypothetical protein